MRFGVSRSGPVDAVAFQMALAAIGADPENGLAIELSMGGLDVTCMGGACGFALTGPGFTATLDGLALGGWMVGWLRAGQRLVVRSDAGNWGYLALSGTVETRRWLGRAATHTGSGLGAGMIAAGQELAVEEASPAEPRALPTPPDLAPISLARAVLGPQQRFFTPKDLEMLAAVTWGATARMDRMGRILEGQPLVPTRLDMPSEPMTFGNLQVDGQGRVTLLLADHQTTGGYPKIATLLARDATRVAQLPANRSFRLKLVSATEAIAIARAESARLQSLLAEVRNAESLEMRLAARNLITAHVEDED
jgi:allophanate hydrolase